mmetsp:Transcript_4675/g.8249  ORF Transcript_4675/g.8249 Transcript_4675/m.8249 type:complete len:192 (+) Transcript_4675:110-685(+)|eukprot:CAMPEP_0184518756 /NCGR_PEP_ID=MMETSP0198_2-20121128/6251_1 /TAXON_ID=1112570 /ORGANISM="Thraustochytrium sp., Strain LLF1b" /LENGTH=191 /DNA_ID=CAMNT_0026909203 /DNA_START=213 /DNA_END=788 /DNA_ORIENTATION=+
MAQPNQSKYARLGDACYSKLEKINAELFTLTYGALVADLVKTHDGVEEVNQKLDEMGYNVGLRLIDEFLAKSNVSRCGSFRETAELISMVGFKMFLNITPEVRDWDEKGTAFTLSIKNNPLEDFVELPSTCAGLKYCNFLCGVVRGALFSVQLAVKCDIVADMLMGDPSTEIRVTLEQVIGDQTSDDYHDE